jgi:uncharacterized membrane protein (DUF2068 family)
VETIREVSEAGETYFGATSWWPVIRAAVALALVATLLRIMCDRLPFIPAALRIAGAWVERLLLGAVRASAAWLRDALTYKRATEPRWVKPLGLWMDVLLGSYFGLLFSLMFIQYSGYVIFADGSKATWRYVAVAAVAFVVLVAARVFIVQARDAWCEIRERRKLPVRTGHGNP